MAWVQEYIPRISCRLCRYVEVIEGEVDMQQQRDQVREAGDKWLNSLPESRRVQVLGREGLKAWEDGKGLRCL